ncbi:hypothetical protein LV476_01280 [Guyparkeria hydrothermalis]|nr:hypothetical protein [Guyparkeria hydrothermalis]MCL7743583.1 hypothetical protein [Guyparkeria hydrothermalis]
MRLESRDASRWARAGGIEPEQDDALAVIPADIALDATSVVDLIPLR